MKNSFPKISIITPVFNGEKYLEATIASILNQNYPNLEYIIIDGASKDKTLEIANRYKDRIFRIISEPDQGIYDALNKGFSISSGDIMCWLNADDLLHPNALMQVAELFLQFEEVEWISGQPTNFDHQGICRQVCPQRKWSDLNYLMGDYFTIQQESVFWRRSLWERSGAKLDTQFSFAGDMELWMRFFRNGAKLYSTELPLGGFRRHSVNQLSAQGNKYRDDVKRVYSQLVLTKNEQARINRMKRLMYMNKFPLIRRLLRCSLKMEKLYDYPDKIQYDFTVNKFKLHK